MTQIDPAFSGQTVITTFEMTPGTCADLLDELRSALDDFIRHQPGFISASLHVNDAQTRIANYSQWQRRDMLIRRSRLRAKNTPLSQGNHHRAP